MSFQLAHHKLHGSPLPYTSDAHLSPAPYTSDAHLSPALHKSDSHLSLSLPLPPLVSLPHRTDASAPLPGFSASSYESANQSAYKHGRTEAQPAPPEPRAPGGCATPNADSPAETCPVSTGRGTRRVQLVRGEGRDVSSQYGREGGGGAELLRRHRL